MPPQRILILDFGAQYTRLIARAVRELGVYCEIFAWDASAQRIAKFAPRGIILSGGPDSASANTRIAPPEIFEMQIPILGICYGMQTMAAQLGGEVETAARGEYGRAQIETCGESMLLGKTARTLNVWMSHGDRVTKLPPGFRAIAVTPNTPNAAIACGARKFFGVQFHPEVTQTEGGRELLSKFVHEICACDSAWNPHNIAAAAIEKIRAQVGKEKVLLGLSGGVDSSVAAALLHRAIGAQLTCIFVDTGLLRMHEGDLLMQTFAENLGVTVRRVNAAEIFFAKLKGVTEPERKRKIIGGLFIEIFEQEARRIRGAKFLAQGTIYPDVIESAGEHRAGAQATLIKSHHNVGGLPARMRMQLVEPLRDLFKDEVRAVGRELGLPESVIARHPFPGPGLAVRILGEVRAEFAEILRHADAIFLQELESQKLLQQTAQAFAVFLPVRSTGVSGDKRAYEYVIALRAVTSSDFMTADWARLPPEFLAQVAARICNEVRGVSRVVYDISAKPPATIEWE